jgi:hypothetical protein
MGKFYEASERTPHFSSISFKNNDVFVDISKFLHHQGIGLYASRSYNRKDVIQEYVGTNITDEQAESKRKGRKYMCDVKVGRTVLHVIDGSNSKKASAVRYANSVLHWGDRKRNSELVQYKHKIYLVATSKIKRNSEIITFYGEDTELVINEK